VLNRYVTSISIGYYTVDCTIPNYIWTSAQMTTNIFKLYALVTKENVVI